MRQSVFLLWFVVVTACMEPEVISTSSLEIPAQAVAVKPKENRLQESKTWDPYENVEQRCEAELSECQEDKDCKAVVHPSGKKLKCVKPYWGTQKVCSPGWSNRIERAWRKDRLAIIVEELSGPPELSKFLWTIYSRETTGRPWKRHRLNGDIRFAHSQWYKQHRRYGWAVAKNKKNELAWVKPCKELPQGEREDRSVTKCRFTEPSPFFKQRHRWEYGLGPYGQTAALWTATWDPQAPPEILCGEVEATETYLRGARRAWKKLRGGITCNGQLYRPEPTWEDLHRAVSGGKLCPGKKGSPDFRRRARYWKLNPDQRVTLKMLGQPMKRDEQNIQAMGIYALLNGVLPAPPS